MMEWSDDEEVELNSSNYIEVGCSDDWNAEITLKRDPLGAEVRSDAG